MNFVDKVHYNLHHPLNGRRSEVLVDRKALEQLLQSFIQLDANARGTQPLDAVGRHANLKYAVELCYAYESDSMEVVLDLVMATISNLRHKERPRREL